MGGIDCFGDCQFLPLSGVGIAISAIPQFGSSAFRSVLLSGAVDLRTREIYVTFECPSSAS